MKKLNKKGFTMVELLATIAIFSILSMAAVSVITRYINYSRKKSYDTMAKSAANATEDFIMDYPDASRMVDLKVLVDGVFYQPDYYDNNYNYHTGFFLDAGVKKTLSGDRKTEAENNKETYDKAKGITFKELFKDGYLSSITDPAYSGKKCSGRVMVGKESPLLQTELENPEDYNPAMLEKYSYVVYLCCRQYIARYTFIYGSEKIEETVSTTDLLGNKYTKDICKNPE